jgi:hypothetical protein
MLSYLSDQHCNGKALWSEVWYQRNPRSMQDESNIDIHCIVDEYLVMW